MSAYQQAIPEPRRTARMWAYRPIPMPRGWSGRRGSAGKTGASGILTA